MYGEWLTSWTKCRSRSCFAGPRELMSSSSVSSVFRSEVVSVQCGLAGGICLLCLHVSTLRRGRQESVETLFFRRNSPCASIIASLWFPSYRLCVYDVRACWWSYASVRCAQPRCPAEILGTQLFDTNTFLSQYSCSVECVAAREYHDGVGSDSAML